MVATMGADACITSARGRRSQGQSNIEISQADFDELNTLGRINSETYRTSPAGPDYGRVKTDYMLEGLVVAVMGDPVNAATFEPRQDKMTATQAAEARDRSQTFAQGNHPVNAISAVEAIVFAIDIEDHFDRLQWLVDWRDGAWGEMRKNYPDFGKPKRRNAP